MQYKNSKCLEKSIDNSRIQTFIFNIRLLFVAKEKITPQQDFLPLRGIPSTPQRYLENTACDDIWTEFVEHLLSSWIIFSQVILS